MVLAGRQRHHPVSDTHYHHTRHNEFTANHCTAFRPKHCTSRLWRLTLLQLATIACRGQQSSCRRRTGGLGWSSQQSKVTLKSCYKKFLMCSLKIGDKPKKDGRGRLKAARLDATRWRQSVELSIEEVVRGGGLAQLL